MKRAPRCTKIEYEQRVDYVRTMLCRGVPSRIICSDMVEKHGISKLTYRHYHDEATEQIRIEFAPNKEKDIARASARLESYEFEAAKKKDFRTAIAAVMESAKLKGHLTTEKESDVSDEQAQTLLDLLDAKRAKPNE